MSSTMRKVIANTTSLIALADVGHLDLLQKLYGEVTIPQAVLEEIISEPAKSAVASCDWIKVRQITNEGEKKFFKSRLHAGEVEVMILAEEMNADLVIMDDNAAKNTAKYMGFQVTGTFGVLLKSKKEGFIDRVKPVMEAVVDDGLFISDSLRKLILDTAGES